MRPMGRPRSKHKDLPRGLYKDAAGRFTLKAFTERDRARLGGKATVSVGRDPKVARQRWAEAFGFRDHEPPAAGTVAALIERFLEEDLIRIIKKKGKPDQPKYARTTQKEYRRIAGKLLGAYGSRKFARSEAEAALGGFFRTMDVSAHLRAAEDAGKGPQGNRDMAVLGSIFRYAKESGETEYNPCLGASRNPEEPRDQELHDALFLELYAEASPVLQCLMDLNVMIGSRVSDLLRILESDWGDKGLMAVPSKRKRGQPKRKQLFERTEDLAGVIDRALALKRVQLARDRDRREPVKSLFLFVSGPDGQPYTMSGFQSMVRATKARAAGKRLAAAGVEKPSREQLLEAVRSIDIHFHDGRARAGQDAEDRGEDPAKFLGHEPGSKTAHRHYLNRRVTVLQPNPENQARLNGNAQRDSREAEGSGAGRTPGLGSHARGDPRRS